jgi:hypothetical protein
VNQVFDSLIYLKEEKWLVTSPHKKLSYSFILGEGHFAEILHDYPTEKVVE